MSGRAVLGVSGSVAAYRAADLARELMRAGFEVRTCLTDGAQQFVTPALFEALTGQPCLVDTFEEPERGRMAHIDWARAADVLVVAPATANVLAKLAGGLADDMLSTLALAYEGPWVIAPAMNPSMYANEATQASMRVLRARAARFVEPVEGDVACGENGQGKLASIAQIVEAVLEVARVAKSLEGRTVLITSGPTQEAIDSVRYLSNRSSGRMGAALARAALLMGARVQVVAGPGDVPMPRGAEVVRVRSAREMLDAALPLASGADWILGVAAVADYRPAEAIEGKRRRDGAPWTLELVPNPDVLASLAAARKPGARAVGFAAEPGSEVETAQAKIAAKGLDAIAVNDVSRSDIGFESESNDLALVFADGRSESSGRRSKLACALWLLRTLSDRLGT
ncbi:MAG: bifunctional phosphopantothenoylcysteine decarboxylase/phosphopantothenate--cysteine ligase CoaBC [Fimbriimonadaceae bacterium]|nr:bifunctional phosphopantothenoylcysteine decarboxylase/phosphopantothenate--cysteine ligase CoaBC [Fimbriimonadaceae bacterium]